MGRRILVVCTGNLCRSPMAAAFLRARLACDEARLGWRVDSAGIWVTESRPASPYAIAEMAQRGLDLSTHRSRPVTREAIAEADLILVMETHQAEALKAAFPACAPRIRLLSEMIGERFDVSDPYGGSREEYAVIADQLEALIAAGYGRIVALAESEICDEP